MFRDVKKYKQIIIRHFVVDVLIVAYVSCCREHTVAYEKDTFGLHFGLVIGQ